MRRVRASWALGLLVLVLPTAGLAVRAGDVWTGRRGDLTPAGRYNALVETHTGRLLAVGNVGRMTLSDDGFNWRFRRMETPAGYVYRDLTDVAEITVPSTGQSRLVAIAAELTFALSPLPKFPYSGITYVLVSDDDGETWTEHEFPVRTVTKGAVDYEGVALYGLHVSPAGEVLAFGTTIRSNLVVSYLIGGLIFRSANGIDWTEAHFAHGALEEIADAGGRLVAVGAQTVLDSADGSGWDGYLLEDANVVDPDSDPLDAVTVERLRLSDVVHHDGFYTAQGATYVPYDPAGTIDSSTVSAYYTLVAENPFDGGRFWTAHEQPRYFGTFLSSGAGLLGFLARIWQSLDHGETFTEFNTDVDVRTRSVARTGPQTLVAVEDANTVWQSGSDGATWAKIWDRPAGPELRLLGVFDGRLHARPFDNSDTLWSSDDNGETWAEHGTSVTGIDMVQQNGRLILASGTTARVYVSDDGGDTWEERSLNLAAAKITAAPSIVKANAGRLLLIANGREAASGGNFFVSDDDGDTWQPKATTLGFNELARDAVRAANGDLVAVTNTFATFNPTLVFSTDNGETWTNDTQYLVGLDGLDLVSGSQTEHVFTCTDMERSPTGRLLMRGDDEILTSDDHGRTWTVRVNLGFSHPPPNQFEEIYDLVRVGSRWIAVGERQIGGNLMIFALTSDDDGTTWREVPIPVQQSNTRLRWLSPGNDGRVVAAGTNAAVYTSEGDDAGAAPPPPTEGSLVVREADTLAVAIERPPLAGVVDVRYSAVQDTALAGDDYEPAGGVLTWTANETDAKSFDLVTVDDDVKEPDEVLHVQFVFENDDVRGTGEYLVTIRDDDGGAAAALQLDGADALYTDETGTAATLRIALDKEPTADVVVTVTNGDPTEGSLSETMFTFTPGNWNTQQSLVVTGVDDGVFDGDVSYPLTLDPASTDGAYDALPASAVYVVNADDDPPPPTTSTTTTTTTTLTTSSTTSTSTSTTSTTAAPPTSTTALSTSTTSTTSPPSTTTTVPAPPCVSDAECDDADPCTEDVCVASPGCVSTLLGGFDGPGCRVGQLRTAPCGGDEVPKKLAKQVDKKARGAQKLIGKAANQKNPKKRARFVKKADRALRSVDGKASKAARKGQIGADCAAVLQDIVRRARASLQAVVVP